MAVNKFDTRQTISYAAFSMAGTSANAGLNTVLAAMDAEIAKLFEDRNAILADGGLITFTGTQIQFTENLNLVLNSRVAGGAPQVISLGSSTQTLANGDIWYATVNRSAGTATTAIASSLPAVTGSNQEIFLIAKRTDAGDSTQRIYWRNAVAFNAGQVARLGTVGGGFAGFADGSVTNPGGYFTSQVNTGFFRPATSVIGIAVNGAERSRFNTLGLYINGTTDPSGGSFSLVANESSAGNARVAYLRGAQTATSEGGIGPTMMIQNTNSTVNNFSSVAFAGSAGIGAVYLYAQFTDHTNGYGRFTFVTRDTDGFVQRARIQQSGLVAANGGSVKFENASGNTVDVKAAASTTNHTLTLPGTQTAGPLVNDGAGTLAWGGGISAKNYVINGNFDFSQRNTTFTTPTSAQYGLDRFNINYNGTAGTFTLSQQAFTVGQPDVPNEPQYFMRLAQTVASSGASFKEYEHRIEGVRTLAGKTVTLSFWAKADASRAIYAKMYQFFGTGGSPSSVVGVTQQNGTATTTWQKFVFTFILPSISGKTLGTTAGTDYIAIQIGLPINTTFTVDVSQVMLNEGSVAAAWAYASGGASLNYGAELALCRRFYEKTYDVTTVPGTSTGVNARYGWTNASTVQGSHFTTAKRIAPTVTFYSVLGSKDKISQQGDLDTTGTATAQDTGQNGFRYIGGVTGTSGANTNTTYQFTADAEL